MDRDKLDKLKPALDQLAQALEKLAKGLESGLKVELVASEPEGWKPVAEEHMDTVEIPYGFTASSPVVFDADGYVREHCHSYIYGLTSSTDIQTIESDPNLSYAEKEEAKAQLDHLSALYY